MFLKMVCFGSKIYIESIKNGFQSNSSFTKPLKLVPSTPTPNFTSLDWVPFTQEF